MHKINYQGKLQQVKLGNTGLAVGGDACFAFHSWEGQLGARPVLALEIWDIPPVDWASSCRQAYPAAVLDKPALWAKAAVAAGAQAINLELKSIDPNNQNAPASQAVQVIGQVLEAIDVPVIIWGSDNVEKDAEVLSAVAKAFSGKKLILAPVEEANYKLLATAAVEHGHTLVASSPIDINLAKQLNILLQNQGVPLEQVLIDPTTGGLGYGLEYTYSVMERISIASMQHNDPTLALPLVCNLGKEIWKSQEAKQGPPEMGIMMEVSAGVSLLLAGAKLLILGHPQSLALLSQFVDQMCAAKASVGE